VKILHILALSTALLLRPGIILAEDVTLPAPVLEWSIYVLLIFAFVVAIGIFFRKSKNTRNEPLSSVLAGKRAAVHSIDPDTSVTECVRQMNEQGIGAMLVMKDERLVGIFTERDAMTKVLGKGLDPTGTKIAAVMSPNPICVTPSTTLDEAMAIVSQQRFRHLPVVQDGEVLGMVSSGDLTHWLVEDKSGEIRELVDIAGRGGTDR
jgi:CBS domain-containing protein